MDTHLKVRPVAVSTGDWHMTIRPPVARAESPSEWLGVQANYMAQIAALHTRMGGVPILHGGDILDRWDAQPELINFLIDYMPEVYAVAGNHDTPNHDLRSLGRSAYETLVRAGKVHNLTPAVGRQFPDMVVYGYPCGVPVRPIPQSFKKDGKLAVCLAHAYAWKVGHSHPNARVEDRLDKWMDRVENYDVVLTSDNHSGFEFHRPDWPCFFNPGTFIRRKADEINYRPRVGILYSDGSVSEHYLDTSEDRFVESEVKVPSGDGIDAEEFMKVLKELGDVALDFGQAVRTYLREHKVGERVKKLVLKALEEK